MQFDDTMVPPEQDRDRPEKDVNGVSYEVGNKLDEFGECHPCCQGVVCIPFIACRPRPGAVDEKPP